MRVEGGRPRAEKVRACIVSGSSVVVDMLARDKQGLSQS
jgi:hypothetical protein